VGWAANGLLKAPNRPFDFLCNPVQVQVALAQKVSKERVGAELDGMFNGGYGYRAVHEADERLPCSDADYSRGEPSCGLAPSCVHHDSMI